MATKTNVMPKRSILSRRSFSISSIIASRHSLDISGRFGNSLGGLFVFEIAVTAKIVPNETPKIIVVMTMLVRIKLFRNSLNILCFYNLIPKPSHRTNLGFAIHFSQNFTQPRNIYFDIIIFTKSIAAPNLIQ